MPWVWDTIKRSVVKQRPAFTASMPVRCILTRMLSRCDSKLLGTCLKQLDCSYRKLAGAESLQHPPGARTFCIGCYAGVVVCGICCVSCARELFLPGAPYARGCLRINSSS